jgi:hypothetical protein
MRDSREWALANCRVVNVLRMYLECRSALRQIARLHNFAADPQNTYRRLTNMIENADATVNDVFRRDSAQWAVLFTARW